MVHQEAPSEGKALGNGPLVKRSRHRPLTPVTRVRFPHGSPRLDAGFTRSGSHILYGLWPCVLTGAYYGEVPPVPIPNTVVKLIRAEDTWRVTAWKNRSVPVLSEKERVCVLFLFIFKLLKVLLPAFLDF